MTTAALTNFKNPLKQIARRLERREFALDVAIYLSGLSDATIRALLGQPAADAPRDVIVAAEFGFTGKSKSRFSALHPLCGKIRSTWDAAVRGVFETLTGSSEWPPAEAPAGMVEAALQFDPAAVQLYKGLKISRPGVSNTTLQCSPDFHGRPRQDVVLLSGGPDATYDDIQTMEYGLVHCFFSYNGAPLISLLRWGAGEFGAAADTTLPTQFFLMQRYRPNAAANALLPLRNFAAKVLSNDFETESVAVIHKRAQPMPWFHGTHADDRKKKKGAIFPLYD